MDRVQRHEEGVAHRDVPRRLFLRATGALAVMSSLPSCDLMSTNPDSERDSGTQGGSEAKEAPMLAEQVGQGQLPPLADRLPTNPFVVEPVQRTGVYGGEFDYATIGQGHFYALISYDHLLRWDPEFERPIPDIAETVEVADGGREYVFKLREGMRWSDGEPFTADDIVFIYDDVLNDTELHPAGPPSFLTTAGQPARLVKIDDYTVRFEFAEPNGLFEASLAHPQARDLTKVPRHYLQQFHKKYNPDVVSLAEEEGFPAWTDLFSAKMAQLENPDVPTLSAWMIVDPFDANQRVTAERNPYYWRTDPDGRQLPYIDRVTAEVGLEEEVTVLKAANGELHLDIWNVSFSRHKPVLARSREQGEYGFFDVIEALMNHVVIGFNLTHQNMRLREVFQNKDFRIGLSYAINRDEIISAVFQRQGEPWQAAPRRESRFYDEELAKQFTAYDPDLANDHLDRAGFVERDEEGFRLRSDGERISFAIAVPIDVRPGWVETVELIQGYWQDVGMEVRIETESPSLYRTRIDANEHDANLWSGVGGLVYDALLDPSWYFPFREVSARYAVPWARWYTTGGDSGEEPPEAARRQMQLYDRLKSTPDEAEQDELFMEILQIAKEEFYVIGCVLPGPRPGVVKNELHNVPAPMIGDWTYPSPGPTHPEQYFIEQT